MSSSPASSLRPPFSTQEASPSADRPHLDSGRAPPRPARSSITPSHLTSNPPSRHRSGSGSAKEGPRSASSSFNFVSTTAFPSVEPAPQSQRAHPLTESSSEGRAASDANTTSSPSSSSSQHTRSRSRSLKNRLSFRRSKPDELDTSPLAVAALSILIHQPIAIRSLDTSRQSIEAAQKSESANPSSNSAFFPSSEAPPVPVLPEAYMQFRSRKSSAPKEPVAKDPLRVSPTVPKLPSLHNIGNRADANNSGSSSQSTTSSQSTSSLTSRSSSMSTVASSYPTSPAIPAAEQFHKARVSASAKATATPLARQPSRPDLKAAKKGSVVKDDPSESPVGTLMSLESSAPTSFKASFKRRFLTRSTTGHSVAHEPATPDLVDDSSSTVRSSDSVTSTPPRNGLLGLDPIVTDSGKLDFFGTIQNLPTVDGHGQKPSGVMSGSLTEKPIVESPASALGVRNLGAPMPSLTLPLAPSPVLTSAKRQIPIRAASIGIKEQKSFDGSPASAFTHRKARESESSIDLGSELMMAVLSAQALDKEEVEDSSIGRSLRQTSLESTYASTTAHGRPSLAFTARTTGTLLSASPENTVLTLPPIASVGATLRLDGKAQTPSSPARPARASPRSMRKCYTEAELRALDRQEAIYAERFKMFRPQHGLRPGQSRTKTRYDDDSEDDYGADEDEEEEQADESGFSSSRADSSFASVSGRNLLQQPKDVEPQMISPTSGSVLFPSTFAQSKAKRGGNEAKGSGSAWDETSDEEGDQSMQSVRSVRPEPGLDVPAKRALYTCTLLKIHPHLAPHFLVAGSTAAQPLAAVALAANKEGSDNEALSATEVRFPRSTNPATLLAGHASTTSLARGGLRIALARAQVMRSLKRRRLPITEEVEISWFQRKYGSELVAPDKIMAEMGRRLPVKPEALVKPPTAGDAVSSDGGAAVATPENPVKLWATRPRFAERMTNWVTIDDRNVDVVPERVVDGFVPKGVAKAPVLLLSDRICALAGVPKPTWTPPRRWRTPEERSQQAILNARTSMVGELRAAPWLAIKPALSPSATAPSSPKEESTPSSPTLGATEDNKALSARPVSAISSSGSTRSVAADKTLMRNLQQALPGSLVNMAIAEEDVGLDSDEEDLPLGLLQANKIAHQRQVMEAQVRQRELTRRRELEQRKNLERNKAMLAEARERRAKGDSRASLLLAHDYGAGDASKALGPSEQRRENRTRVPGPESDLQAQRPRLQGPSRSAESDRRNSKLSPGNSQGPLRSSSATNLRDSFIEASAGSKLDRRISRMASHESIKSPVTAAASSKQTLLSPPAPASIRHRSPDRSSTMPTPGEMSRGVSMASLPSPASPYHPAAGLSSTPEWPGMHRASTYSVLPVPLATPQTPFSPNNGLHASSFRQKMAPGISMPMSSASLTAHERMVAALSHSPTSPSVAGYMPHEVGMGSAALGRSPSIYVMNAPHPMSMYGSPMHALQMQQSAMMAAQMQQNMMQHQQQQHHQQAMGFIGAPQQPLIALDARHLPASATVLRRTETFR
ncbi:hypothetical protein OC861_001714 [Tilletia horrida]|nr:hypothetical protein OC861_001714 [Tilletia horrida]